MINTNDRIYEQGSAQPWDAKPKAILMGVQQKEDITYYMEELEKLAEADGIEVVGVMTQNIEKINAAIYIGKGKLEELREACMLHEADLAIFNEELSGVQLRNIEDVLGCKVIDRTILILDIFSTRAISREGKLQVELAQLNYRMPRLLGFGKSLSKIGGSASGGIGTRGPGEKKLETDRRHISKKMDEIRKEIEEVRATRGIQRAKREKAGIPVVAIAGYTNSGKSTLMNQLLTLTNKEEKSVYAKDMLFATLDTAQRSIKLESNEEFILIDTVGFVSRLPHTLVNAFKATLEEIVFADVILHVIDGSYEEYAFHVEVTDRVLHEIGAGQIKKIYVFNKIDLMPNWQDVLPAGENVQYISAQNGTNIKELIEGIKVALFSDKVMVEMMIPYDRGDISSYLCEYCKVIKMDYQELGTYFELELGKEDMSKYREYLI